MTELFTQFNAGGSFADNVAKAKAALAQARGGAATPAVPDAPAAAPGASAPTGMGAPVPTADPGIVPAPTLDAPVAPVDVPAVAVDVPQAPVDTRASVRTMTAQDFGDLAAQLKARMGATLETVSGPAAAPTAPVPVDAAPVAPAAPVAADAAPAQTLSRLRQQFDDAIAAARGPQVAATPTSTAQAASNVAEAAPQPSVLDRLRAGTEGLGSKLTRTAAPSASAAPEATTVVDDVARAATKSGLGDRLLEAAMKARNAAPKI